MLTLIALLAFFQAGTPAKTATDVTAAQIQAKVKEGEASKTADMPVRFVDAGGYHVGVAAVHYIAGGKSRTAVHPDVVEVYQILEGTGTLVTGGTLTNPQKETPQNVVDYAGPTTLGEGGQGGVTRKVHAGDIVIIPAGVVHYWSTIDTDMTYTIVRFDPKKVTKLK